MAIKLNNAKVTLTNSTIKSIESDPNIYGTIFRISNTGGTSDTLTYINISGSSVTTSTITAGSVVYIIALSGSLSDSTGIGAGGNLTAMSLLINTTQDSTPSFTEQLITTTGAGNWTKPLGVTQVIVECWGGGGAGGGVAAILDATAAGGGAGGQYARSLLTYTSPSITIPYIVAASTAGTVNSGADGADTSWNRIDVYAEGGGGGQKGLNPQGVVAQPGMPVSSSTTGQIVYSGGFGGEGYYVTFTGRFASGGGGGGAGSVQPGNDGVGISGGAGGVESGGTGGSGNNSAGVPSAGGAGTTYGAGGAGGAGGGGTSANGGSGAQGLIRLTYR